MKLTVHLVTWNGAKYVPHLFDSLRSQTFTDWELVVFDNGSTDGMLEKIKESLHDFPTQTVIFENSSNIGFANGHNYVYRETESEYFVLLNQDLWLEQDCFKKMVQFMDAHQEVAVVSPRLMKWNFIHLEDDKAGMDYVYSDQVDSLGLKVLRNRRVVEQYGQKSWEQIEHSFSSQFLEVFGVSGTLPLFRRSAVKAVAYENGDFFDSLYHSYKEDVDLAFRLRSQGYKAYVLLDAVAYHDRSAAGPVALSDSAALKNKKKQSELIRYHSYKNHLMTLYKNEYIQNFLLDFPFILWYEVKKFFYNLFFDRGVIKGLKVVWENKKEIKEKKTYISQKRKKDWKEMRKYMSL